MSPSHPTPRTQVHLVASETSIRTKKAKFQSLFSANSSPLWAILNISELVKDILTKVAGLEDLPMKMPVKTE